MHMCCPLSHAAEFWEQRPGGVSWGGSPSLSELQSAHLSRGDGKAYPTSGGLRLYRGLCGPRWVLRIGVLNIFRGKKSPCSKGHSSEIISELSTVSDYLCFWGATQLSSRKPCCCLVVSDSLRPHGLQPTRLLCPWDSPGRNTGVSCHFLLQGIFPTQASNPGLLHWQAGSSSLRHLGSPCLTSKAHAGIWGMAGAPSSSSVITPTLGRPTSNNRPGGGRARPLSAPSTHLTHGRGVQVPCTDSIV